MHPQNQEILAIIVLAAFLSLLLAGFIVAIVFLYQKRQQQHKIEVINMQEEYDQQILKVQFEMQEATLAEISNKLHDSIKNNINGVVNSLAALRLKWQKKMITDDAVHLEMESFESDLIHVRDEIRLTSHSLSNDKLSKVGFIDTIVFEVHRLQRNNSFIKFVEQIDTTKFYNFTQEQSVFLYRIFQEMIGNVVSHSKATTVNIIANLNIDNKLILQVKDNGIGFNVAEKMKSKLSGIGLSGIQKRCLQIGADCNIESEINKGTTITIMLQLSKQIMETNNTTAEPKILAQALDNSGQRKYDFTNL